MASPRDSLRAVDTALDALGRDPTLGPDRKDALRLARGLLADPAPPSADQPPAAAAATAPAPPSLPGGRGVPNSLHLRLDPETSWWLTRVAFDTGCAKQHIVVLALRAFLGQWPAQAQLQAPSMAPSLSPARAR